MKQHVVLLNHKGTAVRKINKKLASGLESVNDEVVAAVACLASVSVRGLHVPNLLLKSC